MTLADDDGSDDEEDAIEDPMSAYTQAAPAPVPAPTGPPAPAPGRGDKTRKKAPSRAPARGGGPSVTGVNPIAEKTVEHVNLTDDDPDEGSQLLDLFKSTFSEMLGSIKETHTSLIRQNGILAEESRKRPADSHAQEVAEPDSDDPSWWLRGDFTVEDNSVDRLQWDLRLHLKNPNCSPKTWWPGSEIAARQARPVRGSSLFLEHLMGSRSPHVVTVRTAHDRKKFMSVKMTLTKNNGSCGERKMRVMLSESESDAVAVKVDKNWSEASTVHEVVEGVLSMMGVHHMIFPFSYQYLALIRCLHEIRFCFNLGLKEDKQLALVKEIVQKSMDKSQAKAAEGKGPLDYQENVDLARSIVSTQGYSEHLLFRGEFDYFCMNLFVPLSPEYVLLLSMDDVPVD